MIKNFFNKDKKNTSNDENKNLMKMVALLIHAAKIDENYSNEEKEIIINFQKALKLYSVTQKHYILNKKK